VELLSAEWRSLRAAEADLTEDELATREEALAERFRTQMRSDSTLGEALRQELQSTTESAWADWLRFVLVPPVDEAVLDPDRLRAHPEVGFSAERMPIRPALALPVLHLRDELEPPTSYYQNQADYGLAWFGGQPASAGDEAVWPCDAAGRPLFHVVQVSFAAERDLNQGARRYDTTGLPKRGLIQLFHDLETFGEPGDAATEPWHVRWLDLDAESIPDRLLALPDALDTDRYQPAIPINADVVPTIPSPLDFVGSDEECLRYERLYELVEGTPNRRNASGSRAGVRAVTPWDREYEPVEPVSRMGGFGYNESNPDVDDDLAKALPLDEGDSRVLLFDINPEQFTDRDWFHGGRHLQVWIRRSDLSAHRFDDVWCIIRTDG
jgi:uncharacterized protein YwqG